MKVGLTIVSSVSDIINGLLASLLLPAARCALFHG